MYHASQNVFEGFYPILCLVHSNLMYHLCTYTTKYIIWVKVIIRVLCIIHMIHIHIYTVYMISPCKGSNRKLRTKTPTRRSDDQTPWRVDALQWIIYSYKYMNRLLIVLVQVKCRCKNEGNMKQLACSISPSPVGTMVGPSRAAIWR